MQSSSLSQVLRTEEPEEEGRRGKRRVARESGTRLGRGSDDATCEVERGRVEAEKRRGCERGFRDVEGTWVLMRG